MNVNIELPLDLAEFVKHESSSRCMTEEEFIVGILSSSKKFIAFQEQRNNPKRFHTDFNIAAHQIGRFEMPEKNDNRFAGERENE